MHDAIIVGGSYSGLSAGLQLARARKRILVIDAGRRRNRFAGHSHGFLGQDGRPPELIAADASRGKRAQVIDKMAATFILQGALDRLRNM